MTTQWLTPEQLSTYIGVVLPDSFPFDEQISPRVDMVVMEWLTDLIGEDRVTALTTTLAGSLTDVPVALTTDDQAWLTLIRPFLALATWADYVGNANVIYTKTGPVTKLNDKSDPIDPAQRASLQRHYEARAKRYALKLSQKAALTPCSTGRAGSGRGSVKTLRSNQTSYFDFSRE